MLSFIGILYMVDIFTSIPAIIGNIMKTSNLGLYILAKIGSANEKHMHASIINTTKDINSPIGKKYFRLLSPSAICLPINIYGTAIMKDSEG